MPDPVTLGPPLRDPDEPWRLSWGCGPVVQEPWHHSDARWWPGMAIDADPDMATWDHVGDIVAGLPWADGTFGAVVTHHALQMLTWGDLVPALEELRRVLTPGGTLRVSVPSLIAAIEAFMEDRPEHFLVDDRHEATLDGKFCMYVTQGGSTRTVFTAAWLDVLLRRAGYRDTRLVEHHETVHGPEWITELDSRPDESIFMEARR